MATDIGAPFEFSGGQRVAANPQDKWVLTGSDHIAVVTSDGRVFVHIVGGRNITAPFQISTAAPVGANANDHFMFDLDTKIMVVTKDGLVFVHDLIREVPSPGTLGLGIPIAVSVPRKISDGIKVAANPQDKNVLIAGSRILVITETGSVFAHDLVGEKIGTPFQLSPPSIKVAANPQDKHVLAWGDKILVITNDGSVFAHPLSNETIGNPFQLSPPNVKVAALPQDKHVLPFPGGRVSIPGTVMVITSDGSVFGNDLFASPIA